MIMFMMAAHLVRLGHSAISKAAYTQCRKMFVSQLIRNARWGQASLVSRFLTADTSSTSLQTGEETAEPDELFRQVTVEVKGHDPAVLKSYTRFVAMAAEELGVNIARIFRPPKVITRYTVLKSVHIYSKHMVQYEARTHYTVYELKHLTGSTADIFLEYIQRNLPEGMAMKVTKDRLEKIPGHLVPPKGQLTDTSLVSPAS